MIIMIIKGYKYQLQLSVFFNTHNLMLWKQHFIINLKIQNIKNEPFKQEWCERPQWPNGWGFIDHRIRIISGKIPTWRSRELRQFRIGLRGHWHVLRKSDKACSQNYGRWVLVQYWDRHHGANEGRLWRESRARIQQLVDSYQALQIINQRSLACHSKVPAACCAWPDSADEAYVC